MRRTLLMSAVAAAALTIGSNAVADVAPGTTITAANKDAARGIIPDELIPFVVENFSDLNIKIVDTGKYIPNTAYVKATVDYACQAKLDADGRLSNYTAGQPFPYSDWAKDATGHKCDLTPDDPQFSLKLAWDVNYRWQGGSGLNLPHWGFSNMRNGGKEIWRIGQGEYRRTYFSHRADLLPATTELEKGTNVEWAEFFDVKTPFDLRGTMFLLYRYIEQGKEDDTWAYIPALRRVRRIAATQKSDSLLGTEFTLEDFYIFSGYVWDHQWEYKGESVKAGVMNSKRTCFPSIIPGEIASARNMVRLGTDEEWFHCKFGPYNALPFADETFEKRNVFQLDDVPKQKGHPYSRKKIWYDKQTMMPLYAIMYDRAGKPYRIITSVFKWSEDSPVKENKGRQTLNYSDIMIVNVQNLNSHTGQFDNANAFPFTVDESRKYYDTTRLKTLGR
jgi:Protein of unknown function (DUF1329)